MPTASPSAPKAEKEAVMKNRMHAWKAGEMHPGTGKPGVKRKALTHSKKDYKQAVAIALNMSGQSNKGLARKRR